MFKIKLSIILFLILSFSQLSAQTPYFYFYTTGYNFTTRENELQEISYPYDATNFTGVVTWDKNLATQIPIYNTMGVYAQDPNDLYFSETDMQTEFTTARNEWEDWSSFRFTDVTASFGAVRVSWSENSNNFTKDPVNQGGVTPLAISNYQIVPYTVGSESQFDYTEIIFNNSSIRGFKWTTQYILPQDYLDQNNVLNFQNVALHELGHLLGLSHNYDNSYSIMYYPMSYGDIAQRVLTSQTIGNVVKLSQLAGITTGIEDGIMITEDLDHYDINHLYVGHIGRSFIDEYPYGD